MDFGIDPQNRGHDRVEPLRLTRISAVRSGAVAEPEIAAAGVEQAVVRRAGPGRRVELDVAHRVCQRLHDVGDAQELAPRALERVRGRVLRPPLGDHVVKVHVGRREAGRDEVGRRRVARRPFGVDCVEQAVLRELRMEIEADEAALEAVVDGERERRRDVGVDGRLLAAFEQIHIALASRWQSAGRRAHPARNSPAPSRRD